ENLLSKLALSIAVYDNIKSEVVHTRDVYVRIMQHEVGNLRVILKNLPDSGLGVLEFKKEVAVRSMPFEIAISCYSLIGSKSCFDMIRMIDLSDEIQVAFDWFDYKINIQNKTQYTHISGVLRGVVAEIL